MKINKLLMHLKIKGADSRSSRNNVFCTPYSKNSATLLRKSCTNPGGVVVCFIKHYLESLMLLNVNRDD